MYVVNKAFFKAISKSHSKLCFLYVILETYNFFFFNFVFLPNKIRKALNTVEGVN